MIAMQYDQTTLFAAKLKTMFSAPGMAQPLKQAIAALPVADQAKAREADKAHKAKINRAALDAFIDGGMPDECARQAVTLIAQRKIPAIAITY